MGHIILDKKAKFVRGEDFLKTGKLTIEYIVTNEEGLKATENIEVSIIDPATLNKTVTDAVIADHDSKYGTSN